ncbi:MAG: putative baseplate assembly protein [Planctomycetota bacterium]
MSSLAPDLFQRRFQDLMEIGRARLPSLAPDWTDHNAHDPGITLMELLAWTAETQLYSLSRLRRDERAAYAALLGIAPAGTQAATGLIWSDRLDPDSPAMAFTRTVVIPEDTVITVKDAENPMFRPLHPLLWVPGQIVRLETQDAKGRTTDHTATNGGLPFLPFGERAGRRDVLAMTFECRDKSGLFGSNRPNAKGALWPIGVLVAPPLGGVVEPGGSAQTDRSPLLATLVTDDDRIDLRIASDTTRGLLTTGTLLLDLDNVTSSPRKFTIELRSPRGFPRPPRVLRIEPNVIPILQGRTIWREPHAADGTPDWNFKLDEPGLRFASGDEPVTLEVTELTGVNTWRRCDRLSDHGPNENVYEFDAKAGEVTFGNGINGRILPAGSQVFVTYSVSDGEEGRVARNRKWKVAGFAGTFGVNPDPITGGAASSDWKEERREARRRSRDDHALVSSDDIATAAKALPLLEVARAWVPEPDARTPRTGVVTLVAMRSRTAGKEPEQPPETAQWLENIRRRLAPRMPLGSRLVVVAPRYVEFSIQAVLEGNSGTNPSAIKLKVEEELRKRLSLVDSARGVTPRQPGVPVTPRDVAAWMRAVDGVKRVLQLQLLGADGQSLKDGVAVPRSGLPRWDVVRTTIDVKRPEPGRPR